MMARVTVCQTVMPANSVETVCEVEEPEVLIRFRRILTILIVTAGAGPGDYASITTLAPTFS